MNCTNLVGDDFEIPDVPLKISEIKNQIYDDLKNLHHNLNLSKSSIITKMNLDSNDNSEKIQFVPNDNLC